MWAKQEVQRFRSIKALFCLNTSNYAFYLREIQIVAMTKILSTLEYLINVGYGITILGGHLLQKNKRMVWNNRFGWKKIPKNNKYMGWNNNELGGNFFNNSDFL